MPSTLNALFEDKKIAGVKATTALKNDGIPFMLLPVRIETRFMELDNASDQAGIGVINYVLNDLVYIQIGLLELINEADFHRQLPETVKRLNAVTDQVQLLTGITPKEKDMLQQMAKSFTDVKNILAQKFYDRQFIALVGTISKLDSSVARMTAIAPKVIPTDADAFLGAFEKAAGGLHKLTNRSTIPYQNIKNKKALYRHIEVTLAEAISFHKNAPALVREINAISKTTFNKISTLHNVIRRNSRAITNVLGELHTRNRGWDTFTEKIIAPSLKTIEEDIVQFDANILSYLQRLPEPASASSGELLFTGMKALLSIHKFNAKSALTFSDLKTFRTSFSAKIDFIRRAAEQKLTISAGEESLFKKIHTDLASSFEKVPGKVDSYRTRNNSQRFGKNKLNEYLERTARETISSMGSGIHITPLPKVYELWVRIYPDDIFVHTLEEGLTAAETDAGKAFWNAWWVASNDDEIGKAAWGKLCGPYGSKRASWIANTLSPIKFNTPKNTSAIAAKPFINFINASITAKTLCSQIESTKLSLSPGGYFALTQAGTISSFSTALLKILAAVKVFTNTPSFFIEALKIPVLRMGGGLQTIRKKADQLISKEKVSFNDRLVALAAVELDYKNLLLVIEALLPSTIEEYLTKVPLPFDYVVPQQKERSWTRAPHTYMLPERFVVVTMQGKKFSHVMVSHPVAKELQMGPDPNVLNNAKDATPAYYINDKGDLVIEEGLRWLADYPEAVKKGMGVTISLTKEQYEEGFTKLLVLGVKESDAKSSAQLVEKLFTNHMYAPDGMALLKIGTPTNNTKQAKAGFSRKDNDEEERYGIEVGKKGFSETEVNPFLISDAKRLGSGLGISLSVMQKINNKTLSEVSKAFVMNRALWHATIGHTMEEMWDHVFTYDNIRHTEDFFTKYCIGRGMLPSVRIGTQPYGFLPTTAYSHYRVHKDYHAYNLPPIEPDDLKPGAPHALVLEQKKQVRYDTRLQEILRILNNYWTELRIKKVISYENLADGDTQKDFVEMLGLNASSVEFHNRYSVNLIRKGLDTSNDYLDYDIKDTQGSTFINTKFKYLMINGYNDPSFYFDDEHKAVDADKLTDVKYSRIWQQIENSRIFRGRFLTPSEELKELNGAIISNLPLSTEKGVEKIGEETYIEWLLNNDMDTVLTGNDPKKFPSRSLLFLLMRQSLLQANQEAALNILQFENLIRADLRRKVGDDATYYTLDGKTGGHTYNTKWHLLLKDIDEQNTFVFGDIKPGNPFYDYLVLKTSAPAGRSSMAVYMNKPNTNPILNSWSGMTVHKKYIEKVDAVRASFATLNTIPTEELSFLLAEHLDVCSYRIDTWMNGLVNKRLAEQRSRSATATGIHIGAYGWVENLKRDTNKQKFDTNKIPEELRPAAGTAVYKDPDNEGFIHAPSINHAVTAAILRSAYKANSAEENINNRLSVNISSSRVRVALNLIEGVRNGLPTGALLGFQFEKGLHERYQKAELDKFILPLRKMFPLVVAVKENAQEGKSPAYNSNVINGTALLNKIFDTVKWMDFPSKDSLFKVLMNKKASLSWLTSLVGYGDEYEQVAREIDRMADAFDALGDLAISESVYQIVNGNHVRAAAMVSSLASGKNIPEPQIVETVRSGTVVTQRVLLNLDVTKVFANPVNWNFGATPRAKAEPSLNNWLAGIIGDPATIKCIITYNDNNLEKTGILSLSDLKIQPIDYLFLWASEADVKALIEYNFRKNTPALSTKTPLAIDIRSRLGNWPVNFRTFGETALLLQEFRSLLQVAKPAGADSFLSPNAKLNDANPSSVLDLEIFNRANASLAEIKAAIFNLYADPFIKDLFDKKKVLGDVGQPASLTLPQLTSITNFLLTANLFGIPNSIPRTIFAVGDDLVVISKDLFQQASGVLVKINANIAAAETVLKKIVVKSTPKERAAFCIEAYKALFGKLFLALPLFQSLNAADVSQQLTLVPAKSLLRNNGPLVMQDWMHGISKVRKAMKAIQTIDMIAMAMNNTSLPIQPVQLPYKDGEYWAGAEYPKEYVLDTDKLSLVLIYPNKWVGAANVQQVGLVIDEWLEIIPSQTETTGIAIHYNQPDATAPQTVLLAVTPKETGNWVWEDLVYTLIDTLEMAKNRAVEPDHLQDSALSHILPSILSEVVPPQAAGSDDTNILGVQAVMDFEFNREELKKITLI